MAASTSFSLFWSWDGYLPDDQYMINDLAHNVYNCTILNDDRMHSVRNMVA